MIVKQTFKVSGMHCISCALNIDDQLEDTIGVNMSKTNYARQQTLVEFDPAKITLSQITTKLHDIGYQATID